MRALLSVYDKSGIGDFAAELHNLGVELVSSGGTAAVLAKAGLPVTDVADLTGFPPMLGHRVVTLHPNVHGGILADRRDPSHLRDLETHQLDLIDMVVGNLYPFNDKPSTEMIDIGGPAMLRAAAKNHEYVTVLVDPGDYRRVLDEIANAGLTSSGLRRSLARKAFAHTAAYDASIVSWFDREEPQATGGSLPPTIHLSLEKAVDLRYGENPHQTGSLYRVSGGQSWWDEVVQLGGVDLSYLNMFDADAAWRLAHSLGDTPTCAIIKHANPCGVAVGPSLSDAYSKALACDEMSAFGGVVAFNQMVDVDCVAAIENGAMADVIIAPGYEDGVVDRIRSLRKSTRILQAPPSQSQSLSIRQLSDGYLVQQAHRFASSQDQWTVVTSRQPTESEMQDSIMAWRVCGQATSNAIVLAKDGVAWGIGVGQQKRVDSARIAAEKADGRAVGGACASDAFYPFPDGVEAAADAGVSVVIQPGGSVNDDKVIEVANSRGLAMIFTGERQFRH